MVEERARRHLAAILAADVVGYSRLMELDEAGTFARLRTYRLELFEPLIKQHQGRIFKLVGDGLLVEFSSVVNAVECALDLQEGLAQRNSTVTDKHRIEVRIGINLGDVIVEGDDRHGDGVNVAARLQTLAAPGGITISGTVYDHVRNKVSVKFNDLGSQTVKNISEPIRLFSVARREADQQVGIPDAAISDRPSIAILPFINMSGDPEQEYFADGMTEDIITELSRFRQLVVIARNSTFAYKGKHVKIQDVARDLSVAFVVEGSVRKAGGRVRISAQLIEAKSNAHVWAERYDRDVSDVFAIQDEVTRSVVAHVTGQIESLRLDSTRRKNPRNLSAYDYYLRGLSHFNRFGGHEDIAEACRMYEKAIELDPNYARAHAALAFALSDVYWRDASPDTLERAWQAALVAVTLDDSDGRCHGAMGYVLWCKRTFDQSERCFDTALRLNPNDADMTVLRGYLMLYTSRPDEALAAVDWALRLNPNPAHWYWTLQGMTLYFLDRCAQAIESFRHITGRLSWDHAYLAASHAHLGQMAAAHEAINGALKCDPGLTISKIRVMEPLMPTLIDKFCDDLRTAGLPE